MRKPDTPIAVVQHFLRLMEARAIEEAETWMADDAVIIFPGGVQFSNQREMVAAAQGRYQWIKKTFDSIHQGATADDAVFVVIMGTLYGVNRHGVAFEGIRYIDYFLLRDGLICEQRVWNDLAESGVLQRTE